MKKVFLVLILCVVLLASVLLINTLRFTSKQIQIEPIQPVSVDEGSAAQHLAQALRFQTISYQEAAQTKGEEFVALHKYLELTFPKLHSTLTKELVGNYNLLYTWKGRDEKLKPILLMGHQDVVPVEPETLANWEEPPFEGRIPADTSGDEAPWMTNTPCSASWKLPRCCWARAFSLNAQSI